jgi:hypothetical protein
MAARLREAYKSLFQANEYAWKLSKGDSTAKLESLIGAAEEDQYIPAVAGTFFRWGKKDNVDTLKRCKAKSGGPHSSRATQVMPFI